MVLNFPIEMDMQYRDLALQYLAYPGRRQPPARRYQIIKFYSDLQSASCTPPAQVYAVFALLHWLG
jgi:hypothetical protein